MNNVVGLAEFKNRLVAICQELPDRKNPTDSAGNCIYTGDDGEHCIIGEYITRYHPDYELYEDVNASAHLRALGYGYDVAGDLSYEVSAYCNYVQRYADDKNDPRYWARVGSAILDEAV